MTTQQKTRRAGRGRVTRAVAVAGTLALASTLAFAAPARAADPAVDLMGTAGSSFSFDSGNCAVVSGGDVTKNFTATVATKGTKAINANASGEEVVENTGDPTDDVTFTTKNKVTGSVSGTGGAFSKANLVVDVSGKMDASQGLLTDCDPEMEAGALIQMAMTVKKSGKLTTQIDLDKSMYAIFQLSKDGDMVATGTSIFTRGGHTLSRKVAPGTYLMQIQVIMVLSQSVGMFAMDGKGTGKLKLTYSKS